MAIPPIAPYSIPARGGVAGVSGSTLVVNLPGTRAAVRDGMATLGPLASKVIGELSGLVE